MKPWAQWLVNHNMKYVIFLVAFLLLPIYVAAGLYEGGSVMAGWFMDDLKAIARQRKS